MTKHLALDHYLKHWFGQFTKSEIKDWVNNKIELLEQLEKKEKLRNMKNPNKLIALLFLSGCATPNNNTTGVVADCYGNH